MKKVIPIYDICHLATDRLSSEDILIKRFSPYLKEHSALRLPHKHSFYHLIYFTSGEGQHTIDFIKFPVKPGEIYFMIPGQVHSWNFTTEPDGYVINFSENFFRNFLHNPRYLDQFNFFSGAAKDGVVFLPANVQKKVAELFEGIIKENETPDSFGADLIRLWMVEIFMLTARYAEGKQTGKGIRRVNAVIKEFQRLIDEKFIQLRLPKEYAALLFVTPNYLNNLCQQVLDKPAGELIRDRILLEAKRLLVNADLNVSEIANQLNFTDHSHFSKFFKKETGETPEAFRKNVLQLTV